MFCGCAIVVKDAIQASGASIGNILNLAEAAAKVSNFQESYDYYTRALEFDPSNYRAWIGKGLAAGWVSTWHHRA